MIFLSAQRDTKEAKRSSRRIGQGAATARIHNHQSRHRNKHWQQRRTGNGQAGSNRGTAGNRGTAAAGRRHRGSEEAAGGRRQAGVSIAGVSIALAGGRRE